MNPPTPNDLRPALKPPQFRLLTMMRLVGGLCIFFALLGVLGPFGRSAAVLLLLIVGAHVAATKLGTRLRAAGDTPVDETGRRLPRGRPQPAERQAFAPATRLGRRYSLGITIIIVTSAGILLGAALGGVGLAWLHWPRAGLLNIAVGALASGVLGGIGGFALGSFVQVTTGAGFEARRSSIADERKSAARMQ